MWSGARERDSRDSWFGKIQITARRKNWAVQLEKISDARIEQMPVQIPLMRCRLALSQRTMSERSEFGPNDSR